jgi:hypothetical protein
MTTTTVINLYGGSGVGKSTVAALLFAQMKIQGLHVELVREYVKLWAWSGKQVRPTDQIYLLGKQSAYESLLYGKVDYIVTDSPVMLAGAYSEWHSGEAGRYVTDAANSYYDVSVADGSVRYLDYVLHRDGAFDPRGRYETAEKAAEFDEFLKDYLARNGKTFTILHGSETQKARAACVHALASMGQGAGGEGLGLR